MRMLASSLASPLAPSFASTLVPLARPLPRPSKPDAIQQAVRQELVAEVNREMMRMPTRQREVSIESDAGQVALTLHGSTPERVLFSPSEARVLVAEIERALNRGFGRDMEAIRRGAI